MPERKRLLQFRDQRLKGSVPDSDRTPIKRKYTVAVADVLADPGADFLVGRRGRILAKIFRRQFRGVRRRFQDSVETVLSRVPSSRIQVFACSRQKHVL